MGYIPESTPEMGEYSVEVRSSHGTFYLRGDLKEHAITVYAHTDEPCPPGTCEILLADIPKIRAALDLVERVAGGERGL